MNFPKNYPELYNALKNDTEFKSIVNDLDIEYPIHDFEINREIKRGKEKKLNEEISMEEIKEKVTPKVKEKMQDELKKKESKTLSYARFMQIERTVNNQQLKSRITELRRRGTWENKQESKQIFLSYSLKEALLALMLFYLFKRNGLYLYVDYLNNGSIRGASNLKNKLGQALDKSNQLLLIDGRNNEIILDSHTYIRPWCAWENGYYKSCNKSFSRSPSGKIYRLGWSALKGNSNNINMISDLSPVKSISLKGLA